MNRHSRGLSLMPTNGNVCVNRVVSIALDNQLVLLCQHDERFSGSQMHRYRVSKCCIEILFRFVLPMLFI